MLIKQINSLVLDRMEAVQNTVGDSDLEFAELHVVSTI